MAAGKRSGSGGVRIEVQRKGNGWIGLIYVNSTGTLVQTCGHDDHPAPGKASNCAREISEAAGHRITN